MQEILEDYYEILGVAPDASADDIRKAYLKLAKKLHPDRFPNDPEKKADAQEKFAKVTRAHEVLGDARQREEYDALRLLARSRAALDEGVGGSAGGAPAASAAAGSSAAGERSGTENKGEWAARHSQRAMEYVRRKKFQEAETAAKEAIRLDPTKNKYRIQLAEIYLERGWKTLAMTEIQTALRMDPNDHDAKTMELRLKSAQKGDDKKGGADKKGGGGGFLDQLSKLLGKK